MRGAGSSVGMLAGLVLGAGGCIPSQLDTCPGRSVGAGDQVACATPGWVDRAFELTMPMAWNGAAAVPLIVVLHGGGGSRRSANRITCRDGDESDPSCLVAQAASRGYAVVIPDGTGQHPLRNVRTWNGGGGGALQCTSGPACHAGIDDVRYFDDLVAEVRATVPIDARRIYVTGISNGGAMAHRLGCERPDVVAALVGVAGANEFADDGGACPAQVPVRQIHGTLDPCWAFDGGTAACLQDDGEPKTSVAATMNGWSRRNGCGDTVTEVPRPDRDASDGTTAALRTWAGCAAATELLVVTGGGHTWPNGEAYAKAETIGAVSREVDNADLLDFFDAHVHP